MIILNHPSDVIHGKLYAAEQVRGYSAYEIAVKNGFKGTETDWLASLASTGTNVIFHTTDEWKEHNSEVSNAGTFYVYSDYTETTPGVKIGDGKAYIGDLPFINGGASAITDKDLARLNNAITTKDVEAGSETLKFELV